ncbi:hypothetical protein AVEN_214667-1 [Araneus ventricosus]|uniref:Uncharacterized protein n=1 Tax=Araneus ventricosus TaxID=182803 RepID=A0A4Y2TZL0_ARAVE|nr:hypothetical protein AVEN_214667-1 [Araneus ventricosus]
MIRPPLSRDNSRSTKSPRSFLQWRTLRQDLTVPHIFIDDQSPKFLTLAFNCRLHLQKAPPSWKLLTTVLIPKSISELSTTIYKLYTKVLAGRLPDWCEKYSVLSPCQKASHPLMGLIVSSNTILFFKQD